MLEKRDEGTLHPRHTLKTSPPPVPRVVTGAVCISGSVVATWPLATGHCTTVARSIMAGQGGVRCGQSWARWLQSASFCGPASATHTVD